MVVHVTAGPVHKHEKEAHIWNAVILNYNVCENNSSKIRIVRFV